jgi:hypothetical protein
MRILAYQVLFVVEGVNICFFDRDGQIHAGNSLLLTLKTTAATLLQDESVTTT